MLTWLMENMATIIISVILVFVEAILVSIAEKVGVDEYYSEVLPGDKARFVESEKGQGERSSWLGTASAIPWHCRFQHALILLGVGGVLQPASSALLHNTSTLAISLKSMQDLL